MARRRNQGCISGFFQLLMLPCILLYKAAVFSLKLLDRAFVFFFACICSVFKWIFYILSKLAEIFHLLLFERSEKIKHRALIASKTLAAITDGYEFEEYVAHLMRSNGFHNVETTVKSGDYGVDILAKKDGKRYAVQCKLYSSPVGPKAVQEVFAGREHYNCAVGVVATNNTYTPAAYNLASSTSVILWNIDDLISMEKVLS